MQDQQTPAADGVGSTFSRLDLLPPRNALIELVAFFALALALDWWLPSVSLSSIQPHPFWLPVLLLSLQYGTVSGLLAAGTAIVVFTFLGWPEPEVDENHFTYLVRIWTQPVLWLAAALLLGQFRMRQLERKAELAREIAALRQERTMLADYSTKLRGRCDALERRIATSHEPSALALLDALARLRAGDGLQTAFRDLGELLVGDGQCSLFRATPGGLVRAATNGWGEHEPWRATIAPGEPLHRAIVGELRGVSALAGTAAEADLDGQGLAAVPIFAAPDDAPQPRVIGMLKVETAAPDLLDDRLLARLDVVAAVLSLALEGETPVEATASRTAAPAGRGRSWRQMTWWPERGRRGGGDPGPRKESKAR